MVFRIWDMIRCFCLVAPCVQNHLIHHQLTLASNYRNFVVELISEYCAMILLCTLDRESRGRGKEYPCKTYNCKQHEDEDKITAGEKMPFFGFLFVIRGDHKYIYIVKSNLVAQWIRLTLLCKLISQYYYLRKI